MENKAVPENTSNKMSEIIMNHISTSAKVLYLEKLEKDLSTFANAYLELVNDFFKSCDYGENLDNWLEEAICNEYPRHWESFDEEAITASNWTWDMREAIEKKINELKGNK